MPLLKEKKQSTGRLSLKTKETIAGYLFVTPSFLGFLMFSLFPLVLTAVLSVSDWNLVSGLRGIRFTGLANFKELIGDTWFIDSLKNNIKFVLFSLPLLLMLGFLFAVLIQNFAFGKKTFKTIFFFPYISSIVAVATVWRVIFQPTYGPINQLLRSIGMENPPAWLMDPKWALPTIAMMYIWQELGYYILIFITGLQAIPETLYEAAEIDGANRWKQIFHITLPLVSPTTFFLFITGMISTFKIFDAVQVLTQGGPGSSSSVLVYYLYKVSFNFYKVGYGSAVSVVLFLIVFGVTAFQMKLQKRWVHY